MSKNASGIYFMVTGSKIIQVCFPKCDIKADFWSNLMLLANSENFWHFASWLISSYTFIIWTILDWALSNLDYWQHTSETIPYLDDSNKYVKCGCFNEVVHELRNDGRTCTTKDWCSIVCFLTHKCSVYCFC